MAVKVLTVVWCRYCFVVVELLIILLVLVLLEVVADYGIGDHDVGGSSSVLMWLAAVELAVCDLSKFARSLLTDFG